MSRYLRITLISSLIIFNIGIVLSQGLYWESLINMKQGDAKKIFTSSYYRPKMFKQSSDYSTMIFRLDKGKMYIIDNSKKEYTELTFKQLEAITKQANSAMEQKLAEIKEQMKSMPPEQREAMQKALDQRGIGKKSKSKIVVTKTGETMNIYSYPCVKYALKEDGKEVGFVWTTDKVKDYDKMKGEMKEFRERVLAQIPNGMEIAEAMQKIKGFPMQTSLADVVTTVSRVDKRSIPVSEFEVPAGYKKVDPQQQMGK